MARYNITTYGASEANQDNLTQIQSAINAANTSQGGEVFFPEGTWKINGILTVYDNLVLLGEGPGSIVDQRSTNAAAIFQIVGTTGAFRTRIHFKDLYLRGEVFWTGTSPSAPANFQSEVAISASKVNQLTIERCYFSHFTSNGVLLMEARNSRVTDCVFFENYFDTTWADHGYADVYVHDASERLIIAGNQFLSNNRRGVYVNGFKPTQLAIQDNVIVPTSITGIPLAPSSVKRENAIVVATGAAKDGLGYLAQTVIANNVCHLTTRAGILLTANTADSYSDTGARTIVSGNIVSQAEIANTGTAEERGGIAIRAAREAVIVNNLVLDTSAGTIDGAGINAHGYTPGTDYLISGNIIKNVKGAGIALNGKAGNSLIAHNTVVACAGSLGGIYVSHSAAIPNSVNVGIVGGSPDITYNGHPYVTGDRLRITSVVPQTAISATHTDDTIYYVTNVNANTIRISLTPGGPVITPVSSSGTGVARPIWERGGNQIVGNHIEVTNALHRGIYVSGAEVWPTQIRENFIRKTTYIAPTDERGGIHYNVATGGIITDNLIENFDLGIYLSAAVTTRMVQEFQISRNVLRKCNKGLRGNDGGFPTGLVVADDNRFPNTPIPVDTALRVIREGYVEGTKVVLFETASPQPPPAPAYGTYETGDRIINQAWDATGKFLDKYRKADGQWADRKTV